VPVVLINKPCAVGMAGCCVLLQIWAPPFHPLTATEVSYLVKGISEVYGVDEDMMLQQGGTAVTAAGVQVRGSRSHTVQLLGHLKASYVQPAGRSSSAACIGWQLDCYG